MDASNAAAASLTWELASPAPAVEPSPAAVRPRQAARGTRDVVDLLWYEPEAAPAIAAHPEWASLLDELFPRPEPKTGFDFDEEPPPEADPKAEQRRDVFAVVARGSSVDAAGISLAMIEAAREDNTFDAPLVLLAGDLFFPFDELETLKATVTAVSPFAASDKKLKETLDTITELLKTPLLEGASGGIAEGLTTKVREAFAQGSRVVPASYVESHTERILLEQRRYQKRTVFGEPRLRAQLTSAGSSGAIPAYLPEALSAKLPMFQSLKVRIIAEAHPQQDQYEVHSVALRVVALGRVVTLR